MHYTVNLMFSPEVIRRQIVSDDPCCSQDHVGMCICSVRMVVLSEVITYVLNYLFFSSNGLDVLTG